MFKQGSRIIFSPSDLSAFLRSPFASWMDRYNLENPGAVERDPKTDATQLLLARGRQHEADVMERFRQQGRDVVEIPRGPEAFEQTRTAIAEGREVICQAALKADRFSGFADFLVLAEAATGDSRQEFNAADYQPVEAKLARRPRPEHIIQLCCYADLMADGPSLAAIPTLALALGSGEMMTLRGADFQHYYHSLCHNFLEFMDAWDPSTPPIPDGSGQHRPWQGHADATLKRLDHPSRVANITAGQIGRLKEAGIYTMDALAKTQVARVPGMREETLLRLRDQARLQSAAQPDASPPFEVVPPNPDDPRRGLALLPPASTLDCYFDIEGFPLGRESLEYLFGVTLVEEGQLSFKDWWAHDRDEERIAFEGFIDWVYARFRSDPTMHVYHYGAYETNVLKRLMGRFGTREFEVDALLSAEVFCDLYQVVKTGFVVGTPSYSIKQIERLFQQARDGEVGTAVDSIVFYQRFLDSGEPPNWEASPILEQIRNYNRDDCDSTLELTSWLRKQAAQHNVAWAGCAKQKGLRNPDEPPTAAEQEHAALIEGLLAKASSAGRGHAHMLLAHLLEFHRREDRPMWWAMFQRHEMTDDDLIEDVNCLGGLRRQRPDPEGGARTKLFRYSFDPEQDTKIREGRRCMFAHDLNVPATITSLDLDKGHVTIELNSRQYERLGRLPDRLALIPSEYVPTDPLKRSIELTARRYLSRRDIQPALDTFLLRRPPSFVQNGEGAPDGPDMPLMLPGESPVNAARRLVPTMDETTLLIQGPPGSGKTTTSARVIVDLLDRGKKVGITSNSHAAVINLMRKCAALRDGKLACMKVGGNRDKELFDACEGAEHCKSSEAAGLLGRLPLVGGTAWLFSRADMIDKLDYLFVDEAGQVSVANLVGVAPSAKNLVLVGDQMQLAQPTQGTHPGESGASTLDYYLGDAQTIPADRGLFLGTSYRLHPELCSLISESFYEGRLQSAPRCENRVVKLPSSDVGRIHKTAGVAFVPVIHEGRTQASPEEVAVICEVVESLCGREHTDLDGNSLGPIGPQDILVVAPYNLQVRKLQQGLPADVRAGTVDRFQGQEAPIVIVTLCASDGHGSPRGLEFLLNPNRLNVALSRAQSLAVVVGHPGLAHTPCTTEAQLKQVNLLCRIFAAGRA